MVTILGFALTIMRAWSNTTIASAITHYIYNGGVTILPIIMMIIANPSYMKYQMHFDKHDSDTKERLLIESIQKEPDLANAYNDLAWLYSQENKNLDKALDLIERALYLNRAPAEGSGASLGTI